MKGIVSHYVHVQYVNPHFRCTGQALFRRIPECFYGIKGIIVNRRRKNA